MIPLERLFLSCTPGSLPNFSGDELWPSKEREGSLKIGPEFANHEPNAGGVDIGATEVFVAVPADRDTESVRSFPTFTQDLHRLADWLQQCQVDTVAMESTGVYWIPLFQILEARGIFST
jgi:hypothetical protein